MLKIFVLKMQPHFSVLFIKTFVIVLKNLNLVKVWSLNPRSKYWTHLGTTFLWFPHTSISCGNVPAFYCVHFKSWPFLQLDFTCKHSNFFNVGRWLHTQIKVMTYFKIKRRLLSQFIHNWLLVIFQFIQH